MPRITARDTSREVSRDKPANPRRLSRISDPELIWPGKLALADRDFVHLADDVPASELTKRGVGDRPDAPNKVIAGDNRDAMRLLLAGNSRAGSLAGAFKLCYLDPPYNTGAKFSTYSDDLASATWLESLRDRLVQIRSLLTFDGSVWLHLDDSEQHHGRALLDEVFGRDAFVATVIWQKRTSRDNRTAFSSSHDYIHVYAPLGPRDWKKVRNGLPDTGEFSNPDSDPRGPWRSTPMSAQAGHATKSQFYTVITPTGTKHDPPPGRCWTYSVERLKQLDAEGRVYWPRNGDGRPRLKRYADEAADLAPSTLWMAEFAGDTGEAKKELLRQFPGRSPFDTPKPPRLMERIISIATDAGDLILDPYLGSGTTAVTALKLGRRFVGIEASVEVVDEIAIPRITEKWAVGAGDIDVFDVSPARTILGSQS